MDAKAPLSLDAFVKLAFCLEGRDKLSKVCNLSIRDLPPLRALTHYERLRYSL
jgi:hypothetical protein